MNKIKQVHFFAQNYPQLQGLRMLPPALLLLLLTIWANQQHGPATDLSLPLLLSAGCLLVYIGIDQYYNRRYGKVKRIITRPEWLITAAGAVLALAAFILDTTDTFMISLLGLVFAGAFAATGFWYWRPARLLFALNIAIAILIGVLSLLPLVGIQDWWQILGLKHSLLAFTFLYGVFGLLAGVIAHMYFIRSLPAAEAK